ncbi:hypothetical protein Pmani_007106 [Petrolisthes manimaculis]|uniref:Protein kinase domain-containing protein n=1 Tax=Petrolisthes manimaculis TaxID=1843537 RepID=A0AAE1UF61_9EUCA|nr:hypothetical protein Pmani_007106 [Petrolisthes manimaculis]
MDKFKTPVAKRVKKMYGENITTNTTMAAGTRTPAVVIPPSPCMKQLGYGTGVNVYLLERFSPGNGRYKSPWAVKKVNRHVPDDDGTYSKRLSFEAGVLKGLQHTNIIGYRSYKSNTTDVDGTPCLMMESGEQSLSDLIETRDELQLGPFTPNHILKVGNDIASALQYLHEEQNLLHGDLKSANILIKGDFEVAKLCDFGVALSLNGHGDECDEQHYIGTECWSAPEALEELICTVTSKMDMFSFGLTLWEMVSLCPPHVDKLDIDNNTTINVENSQDDFSTGDEEYRKALGTRPPLPDTHLGTEYFPVLEIFNACTEMDPKKRPSARQVLRMIECTDNKEKVVKSQSHKQDKTQKIIQVITIHDEPENVVKGNDKLENVNKEKIQEITIHDEQENNIKDKQEKEQENNIKDKQEKIQEITINDEQENNTKDRQENINKEKGQQLAMKDKQENIMNDKDKNTSTKKKDKEGINKEEN